VSLAITDDAEVFSVLRVVHVSKPQRQKADHMAALGV
jgi:hypothetical protein